MELEEEELEQASYPSRIQVDIVWRESCVFSQGDTGTWADVFKAAIGKIKELKARLRPEAYYVGIAKSVIYTSG